jgi:homoserine dehydrogenase
LPTASAVVADILDTVAGRTAITFQRLELWSSSQASVPVRDHSRLVSRYYFRFMIEDRPGTLAQIAGVLGQHGVSIASVIQHEPNGEGGVPAVPLVIMTHTATEGAAAKSVEEIDRLPSVRPGSVRMRVLDEHGAVP